MILFLCIRVGGSLTQIALVTLRDLCDRLENVVLYLAFHDTSAIL